MNELLDLAVGLLAGLAGWAGARSLKGALEHRRLTSEIRCVRRNLASEHARLLALADETGVLLESYRPSTVGELPAPQAEWFRVVESAHAAWLAAHRELIDALGRASGWGDAPIPASPENLREALDLHKEHLDALLARGADVQACHQAFLAAARHEHESLRQMLADESRYLRRDIDTAKTLLAQALPPPDGDRAPLPAAKALADIYSALYAELGRVRILPAVLDAWRYELEIAKKERNRGADVAADSLNEGLARRVGETASTCLAGEADIASGVRSALESQRDQLLTHGLPEFDRVTADAIHDELVATHERWLVAHWYLTLLVNDTSSVHATLQVPDPGDLERTGETMRRVAEEIRAALRPVLDFRSALTSGLDAFLSGRSAWQRAEEARQLTTTAASDLQSLRREAVCLLERVDIHPECPSGLRSWIADARELMKRVAECSEAPGRLRKVLAELLTQFKVGALATDPFGPDPRRQLHAAAYYNRLAEERWRREQWEKAHDRGPTVRAREVDHPRGEEKR